MKKTRILAVLLALLMLAAAATACSESAGNTDEPKDLSPSADAEEAAEPAETEEINSRLAEKDNLPEADFGGKNFTVIGSTDSYAYKYIEVEEMTGEGVNDAAFARNTAVEDRFNTNVVFFPNADYSACSRTITNSVTAGDSDAFDLVQYHVVENSGVAMKGYYLNWYEIPHIDFTRSWWSDSNINDLTINGRCFLAMGDFAITTIGGTYCMYYDKQEAVNYQIEDLYNVVREGRLTLDFLKTLAGQIYTDKNGDGIKNEGDYFALASNQRSNFNTYLWSCDNQIFSRNDTGELTYNYFSEHLVNVYDSCWDLLNNYEGVWTGYEHGSAIEIFTNYGSLLCNGTLDSATSSLVDFEHDYGVIPYPKYDEAQAEYKTMVDGYHEAMAVAKTAADLEFIGTVTEALCAESYKQVTPAFFDVCLKQRYASSREDAEMMDLCVASRVFDLGYVYDNWKGVSFNFEELLRNPQHQDITSYYQKKKKVAEKYYDKVVELFTKDE
jgi:hypothetical protein